MKVLWVELVLLTFSISSSFILHCNTYSPVEYIVRIAEETWLDKSFISFWNETFFKSTTKRFINGSSRVRSLERNSWRSPKNVFVGGWCEEYRSYDTVMLITVSVLFYPLHRYLRPVQWTRQYESGTREPNPPKPACWLHKHMRLMLMLFLGTGEMWLSCNIIINVI